MPKPLRVNMKCGCGGTFFVELETDVYTVQCSLIELSKAWIAVHRAHHEEPAKKEASSGRD